MTATKFHYILLYGRGDAEEDPIRPEETPRNLVAVVTEVGGATRSVLWDHEAETWARDKLVYQNMWLHPDRYRSRTVDRMSAEREVTHFATTPLPNEAELTAIARAGLPG